MPEKRREIKLQSIHALVRKFDGELKEEFGAELFRSGYCLLLGQHYAQSSYIYFSLNPGFPRNKSIIDLASPKGYNIPFQNPEALKKQYVYLHNCQKFFSTYPLLNDWINRDVTSAFLVPWRTANMADLYHLNQITRGQLFYCAGQLTRQIIRDHEAKLLITAGKSALDLLNALGVVERVFDMSDPAGPGGSYQWSKGKFVIDRTEMTVLQIPHFSRANSPAKMRELGMWLIDQLEPFGCAGRTTPVR